eukprot:1159439-Pelagomonas_calceolata.AAC.5
MRNKNEAYTQSICALSCLAVALTITRRYKACRARRHICNKGWRSGMSEANQAHAANEASA